MRARLDVLGQAISCFCGWLLVVMALAAVASVAAMLAALILA